MKTLLLAALLLAALPDEGAPLDPVALAERHVFEGAWHLKIAAKSGSPLLLQEAEREILEGLLLGLEASTESGALERSRYERVYAAYQGVMGLFKDLPYQLIVQPAEGSRAFTLPLRRHPWLTLMEAPPAGWRAELVESGARLVPAI